NCCEFVVADFALIKAALIRVPVNPRYTGSEIEFIVAHSGAAVLITSIAFMPAIAPLRDRLPALRRVIVVDDETTAMAMPSVVGWRAGLDSGSPAALAVD